MITLLAAVLFQSPNRAWSAALNRIDVAGLKRDLTYIASDELEGRGTPSKGLNMAADYIAEQFKKSGLKPAVGNSYFQETEYTRGSLSGTVRNVIGVLPGSDPVLKNTYVLVTAHYDHLGMKTSGTGDLIYNGANDDGSGTVSVVAIARALGALKVKPKRSIVFMTFWGEERGMLGSTYYGKHPIFPIKDTIADINLEQIGRTDDLEGPRVKAVSVTGADYTEFIDTMRDAGKAVGVEVQNHPQYSDMFFSRSDNQALAYQGVPAHTICVAFEYPDYHKVSDSVDKIDFENMAIVDKMIGLTVLMTADSRKEPHWKSDNPKTKRYEEAWKKSHGQ